MKHILLFALALSPALAQASVKEDLAKIDKNLSACLDEDSSTMGMKICTAQANESADKILNSVYQAQIKELKTKTGDSIQDGYNAETLKRLVKAERAWIVFRSAECSYQSTSSLGGTMEGLEYIACVYEKTKTRVIELSGEDVRL